MKMDSNNDNSISRKFFKFPQAFIGDTYKISWEAKILYMLGLNRLQLSKLNYQSDGNSWYDFKFQQCFIFYAIDQVKEDIDCSKKTAIKLRKELVAQGKNKPSRIFVKEIIESQHKVRPLKYTIKPKKEVKPPLIEEGKQKAV